MTAVKALLSVEDKLSIFDEVSSYGQQNPSSGRKY
jgi:hypothetical protein